MFEIITKWLSLHFIEMLGAILGLIYIFLSIRQNILTWPVGLLTSILYVVVFYQAKFYADMGLQVYYVFISIYGWYHWRHGGKEKNIRQLPVQTASLGLLLWIIPVFGAIYMLILYLLLNFTDSPVPYMDTMTTALSIIATWMLARKIIEHWLLWIFIDGFSAGLYIYKDLWATAILFMVYTFMAILGYYKWKKELLK